MFLMCRGPVSYTMDHSFIVVLSAGALPLMFDVFVRKFKGKDRRGGTVQKKKRAADDGSRLRSRTLSQVVFTCDGTAARQYGS
jgi:hypothetical protein